MRSGSRLKRRAVVGVHHPWTAMALAGGQPDLIIRGGTIVDGTGRPPFVGDVAVTGGTISAVGPQLGGGAKREYDARGLLVLPGWIDPHTHFDAQWSWDPYLSPSSSAGVTTCVMGNCGIGFAPCQADRRDFLAYLVEAVEDIPGGVIAEGLTYDFETFEEYLDSIGRKELGCDVAVMIGHSAIRAWVMGKRANMADRPGGAVKNPVEQHEIEAMAGLVKDAVAAGALGFSTSRLLVHRDPQGILTPGALAGGDEVTAICRAIADGGGGVFQMSADFVAYDDVAYSQLDRERASEYVRAEKKWMVDTAREYGEKVGFTFNVFPGGKDGQSVMNAIVSAGGRAKGQVFARTQGFLLKFGARMHPFIVSRTFRKATKDSHQTGNDLLELLRAPEVRAKILSEADSFFKDKSTDERMTQFVRIFKPWSNLFPWTPGYEPVPAQESIAALAERTGKEPLEAAYDFLLEGGTLWKPQFGLYPGDLESTYKLLQHPQVIPGFADGGAHGTMIQDATAATHLLTHWARDRSRGPKLPIEFLVRKQTSDVAELFGLDDRGVLAVGKKADINVIDMDKLKILPPYLVNDLPQGQQRWTQDVEGYCLTLLSGCPTFEQGKPTGKLPGRLVRNPRRDATAWTGVARRVSGPLEGLFPGELEEADTTERSLDGAESKGASAIARLLRNTVETKEEEGQSNGAPTLRGAAHSRL
uniref:Amidohydrolase 3 domain-containing protein n=1 Tax=Alexandrium monilatum TaxID=311494 RepID=A0A7S4V797_9DINO|mmetsp:Transcript_20223/g.63440  ORF Transcript_20223/g.63440 Transcript_20223/m.63440 type:complete len:701 (+) Transcript_20223:1-2103(+)